MEVVGQVMEVLSVVKYGHYYTVLFETDADFFPKSLGFGINRGKEKK